jgi:hypothetical protein
MRPCCTAPFGSTAPDQASAASLHLAVAGPLTPPHPPLSPPATGLSPLVTTPLCCPRPQQARCTQLEDVGSQTSATLQERQHAIDTLHARISDLQTHLQLVSDMYQSLEQEYQSVQAWMDCPEGPPASAAAAGLQGRGGGASGTTTPGYEFITPPPSVGTGGALPSTGSTARSDTPQGPRPSFDRSEGGELGDGVVRNISGALG